MLTVIAQILVGIVVLLVGRQLFWIFIGAVGFFIGVVFAPLLFGTAPDWLRLVMSLALGATFAALAIVIQKPMAVLAGFFAGGLFDMSVFALIGSGLGADERFGWFGWFVFITGGIVGAIAVFLLFDWAVIALSSMVGAGLIMNGVETFGQLPPFIGIIIFVALVATGMWVQSRLLQRVGAASVPIEERR